VLFHRILYRTATIRHKRYRTMSRTTGTEQPFITALLLVLVLRCVG
jgi:hypothetical protein